MKNKKVQSAEPKIAELAGGMLRSYAKKILRLTSEKF